MTRAAANRAKPRVLAHVFGLTLAGVRRDSSGRWHVYDWPPGEPCWRSICSGPYVPMAQVAREMFGRRCGYVLHFPSGKEAPL